MHAEDGTRGRHTCRFGPNHGRFRRFRLTVYDFSITKSVFGMLLILAAMVWMF